MGKVLHLDEFRGGVQKEREPGVRKKSAFAKARAGMLEFKPLRDKIRDEARNLSYYFKGNGRSERPEDFELRLARVCLAMYLIETVDRMASIADQEPNLQNCFDSARKALGALLEDSYFSMSAEGIMAAYSKREPALRHCANRCKINLLQPEPAVEETKMRLADMIDDMNSI